MHFQFIAWDDPDNFTNNLAFRGFSWTHLKWMFSSFHMGVYIPLTWISFALDYKVWGMDPMGYHLTNVLLQIANGLLVYHIARHFYECRAPRTDQTVTVCTAAAAFAALFFAVHPLRVESVAWATERRDLLSGFFFLISVLMYLRDRIKLSLMAYAGSLLSKATGVTLPVLLIVIDLYQYLARPNNGLSAFPFKRKIWEKAPYLVLALPIAVLAIYGQHRDGAMAPLNQFSLPMRIAVMSHGILFYLGKTLWPFDLSPLYTLPNLSALTQWPFIGYVWVAGLITLLLTRTYRDTPALTAAWFWYVIALFPVSGFFQSGGQLTADRYSYLPSLSWAILLGGALAEALKRISKNTIPVVLATASACVMTLVLLSRQQETIWRDTYSFWRYAVIRNPTSASARNNLGSALAEQGRIAEAAEQFQFALQVDPGHPGAQRNLQRAQKILARKTPPNRRQP